MNLRQLFRLLQANFIAGNSTIIRSGPGIGKSEMVINKFALWVLAYVKAGNPNARVGLAVDFIATASPISATGMPWKSTRSWAHPVTGEEITMTVTDPAIPVWGMAVDLETGEVRPSSMFDIVLLVLEEWGQGSAEAKRAYAEVLLKGGTGQHYLPPGSMVVALSNVDTRDGVTKEFDHIINRANDVIGRWDYDIWHDDFADHPYRHKGKEWSMMGATKLWAKQNTGIMTEEKPKVQGPWCTARSATAKDRYVQSVTQLCNGVTPLDAPDFVETCAGYTGMAATQSYINFLRFRLDLPSYEDVVMDPDGTPVPVKADMQMLMAYELAGRAERDDLDKVIQYFTKRDANGKGMPKDMQITFTTSLLRRDPRLLTAPAIDKWTSKNAYLLSMIKGA